MKKLLLLMCFALSVTIPVRGQEFRPIPSPPRDLIEALTSAGNFGTLIGLLETAGFFEPAKNADGGLTLLAPNDEAFAKLSSTEMEKLKKSPDRIRAFLRSHTLAGKVICPPLKGPKGEAAALKVKNLAGEAVSITDTSFSIVDTSITDTTKPSGAKPSPKPGSGSDSAGILDDTTRGRARLLRSNLKFSGGLIQELNASLVAPR